jgi:hypothetical protein
VRVNEVCQALDGDEFPDVRCCIESVCDLEFSQLARCLMPIGVCPWGMGQDGERCIPPG